MFGNASQLYHRFQQRPAAIALLVVSASSALALIGIALTELPLLPTGTCLTGRSVLPDRWFVVVGVASLLIGSCLGGYRRKRPEDLSAKARVEQPAWLVATGASFAALLLATIAITYEALGLLRFSAGSVIDQPITYYVRCTVYYDLTSGHPPFTFVVVAAYCLLFGHWLWYPGPLWQLRRWLEERRKMPVPTGGLRE